MMGDWDVYFDGFRDGDWEATPWWNYRYWLFGQTIRRKQWFLGLTDSSGEWQYWHYANPQILARQILQEQYGDPIVATRCSGEQIVVNSKTWTGR